MKFNVYLLLIFTLTNFLLKASAQDVAQGSAADLLSTAQYICQTILNGKPLEYSKHFSSEFVASIPEAYFNDLTQELMQTTGVCAQTQVIEAKADKAKFQFIATTGRYVNIVFSLNREKLIDGLQVKEVVLPDVIVDSWQAAVAQLKQLPGHASMSINNFKTQQSIQKNGADLAPIGSGFKLYVLGALTDEIQNKNLSWDQHFPLKSHLKSLPAGEMQNWKDGTAISLKTFAEYMIKISDNTATDHLLDILGRDKIQNQLAVMDNHFIAQNRPFLSTAEMFKIKWAAPVDLIQSFIQGNELTRTEILQKNITPLPLDKVGTNGVNMNTPSFIREIEWFASADDLCQAMQSLKNKNSPEVLEILSKNVPNLNRDLSSRWSYAGFKGGSEPGVLSMTYLLQNKNSEWGCVAVTWHNEKDKLNLWIFSDFVGKVLKLAEQDHFGIAKDF